VCENGHRTRSREWGKQEAPETDTAKREVREKLREDAIWRRAHIMDRDGTISHETATVDALLDVATDEIVKLRARCAQYEAVVGAATTALGSLEWAAAKVDKLYRYITRRNAETVVCKSLTGLSEHLHVSAVALNNTVRALAATTPEGK
jgi:hypothetical protein